jgi:hypothetical protein
MLYPATPLEVLVFHPRETLCGGAVPDPVSDCTLGELAALLTNVAFADAAPVAVGVKVIWNEALLPAGMVIGSESPLTVN